jgi:Glyoxalase-like domain
VFGRWIASAAVGRPLGWAVRTSDLDATAERLGLTARLGSRLAPGGQVLRWRIAGLERSMAQPYLPFFIEWAPGTPFPGRTWVDHPASIQKVTRLALQGEIAQLQQWLGDERLPVTVAVGPPAVIGVGLATGSAEMFIGGPE